MSEAIEFAGKTLRLTTEDNLELHGIVSGPLNQAKRGIVYVHGLASHFLKNELINQLAQRAEKHDCPFLTLNTRGHDLVSDFTSYKRGEEKGEGEKRDWRLVGSSYEVFSDCIYDIKAAIDFLEERGVEKVTLLGHSTGANKIAYYQAQEKDERVGGLCFLAPGDDRYLQQQDLGEEEFERSLRKAKDLIEAGKGDDLLPWKNLGFCPISAESYLSLYGPKDNLDIFSFHEEEQSQVLHQLEVPVMLVLAGEDEYVQVPIERASDYLARELKQLKQSQITRLVVDGADHSFHSGGQWVAETIIAWCRDLNSLD